ncbi:MAG: efflux transporter outer membrane subunit [Novosphingobium sp.]|nr:efflux transporter outer membrane subunit [Novosphingobium sp.]
MRRLLFTALLVLPGCSMNPRLDIPAAPVAPTFTGAASTDGAGDAALAWKEMFGDPRLQRLIETALSENRDLRVALLNADAARSQLKIQRASQFPAVEAQGNYTRQRQPTNVAGAGGGLGGNSNQASGFEFGQFVAQAALSSFEIDLFGRLRSQSQAAFETYLASREGTRTARLTIISTVAEAYLAERLAEEQLRLTQATLTGWQASLDLNRKLREAGQTGDLDVVQAEGLVRQGQADQAQRRRELAQATNALVLAVGSPLPADLPAPIPLLEQPVRTRLAAGLPSDLLLNRPDILQAEHELRSANANVGAARAAFFPRLSLTAAFGFASLALGDLFKGNNRSWSFSPAVSVPILQGGQLGASLDLAKIRKSIAVTNYEKAIQTAFREVADGLAGRESYVTQASEQAAFVATADRRLELSKLRFHAGVDSRLDLLDAQRSLYSAQQTLLTVKKDELSNAIALYKSLGGGKE